MNFDTFVKERGEYYNKTQLEQFKEILELYDFKIQYNFSIITFIHKRSSFIFIKYTPQEDKYEIERVGYTTMTIKNYNILLQNLYSMYLRYLKHNDNLHLLSFDESYYTHKYDLDKSIKISIIDYEYIIAICKSYGFYGCYWTNESIGFMRQYDNYFDEYLDIIRNITYVIKITKKYTILLYDNYNIKNHVYLKLSNI